MKGVRTGEHVKVFCDCLSKEEKQKRVASPAEKREKKRVLEHNFTISLQIDLPEIAFQKHPRGCV